MKTTLNLTLHKTFDKNEEGKREVVLYLYDGTAVSKLSGASYLAFLETFQSGTVVRMTAVASLDVVVQALSDRGGVIRFCHWHNSGIDKNLSPEEIVRAYAAIPEEKFRTFTYDADLAQLRRVVDDRNAILQFYGDATRRLKQHARNMGVAEAEDDPTFDEALDALDDIESTFQTGTGRRNKAGDEIMVSFDTRIAQLASKNPLCVLFNQIAGLQAWGTAASIVSIAQGVERFPQVSNFLSYFGMGNAKQQKRKKGQPSNWSARGRLVCYMLGESIIKNKKNPWRQVFDEAKEMYLAKHEASCGCKAKKGHPHAQARRLMVKEILKQFYLAATGQPYVAGHVPNQAVNEPHKKAEGAAVGK
jgi:hypothetical protein